MERNESMARPPVCVCASAKTAAASGEHPHKPAISAHGAVRQPLNEAPSAILARQKMLSTIGWTACTRSAAVPQAARGGQQDDQPPAVHREGLALESQPLCSLPFVLGVCCQRAAVTPAEARLPRMVVTQEGRRTMLPPPRQSLAWGDGDRDCGVLRAGVML
jgi:hypothetical protein